MPARQSTTGVDAPDPLIRLFADGSALTRAEIVERTGHARSTIGPRLDDLVAMGLLRPVATQMATGGRRPSGFTLDPDNHCVLAIDLGAGHARIALVNLARRILVERDLPTMMREDPDLTVDELATGIVELLDGANVAPLVGVGVSLPAPVDQATGRPVHPPLTPRWHDFDLPGRLGDLTGVPVNVDRNNNLMALGEFAANPSANQDMIFVDVSTWIGAGIVIGGQLIRGSTGQVGHIGHVIAGWPERDACSCGNRGCLEVVASGSALLRQFGERFGVATTRELIEIANAGDVEVMAAIREAGRKVGAAVAMYASVLNPSRIVIGGSVSHSGIELLNSVREAVYATTFPMAAEKLVVQLSETGDRAAILGASVLAADHFLTYGSRLNNVLIS